MTFQAWTVFALFWVLFVTTPGPNAVNCISNGMSVGFARALWGVAAILTQATAFLLLSAAGVTALIATSPTVFAVAKIVGAIVLIWLGVRGWLAARDPVTPRQAGAGSIYGRALFIATINAKSVAGYLAAFSQFVQPDVPIWEQMRLIVPTALTITALSYTGYTAIGALLGRMALGVILHVRVRQVLSACFILYGALLGASSLQGIRA